MRLVFCIAFSWFIFLTITSVHAQIGAGPLASKDTRCSLMWDTIRV